MKTIPENNATKEWDKVRIGDALRLINGRAFKPSEWRESGLPIVRIQNLNNAEAPFNYYKGDLPEKFLLNSGDLLFAWSGTPGTSFGAHIWRGGKAWLNQHIFKVVFDEADFDRKFLQLAINQNLNEYIRAAHGGAGLAHITKGRFEQSELLKPMLDVQRAIVAEIERQFSRLDEAVANLKRVKANLKRYKASVLKAAVEGKLTEDWRKQHPNVEPASKLLERILVDRRAKWTGKERNKELDTAGTSKLPALPDGWVRCISDALFSFVTSGSRGWAQHYSVEGPLFLRIGNLDHDSIRLDLRDVQRVKPPAGTEGARTKVEEGDILVSITADVGMIAVVPPSIGEAYINQHVALARPVSGICREYLAWYLAARNGGQKVLRRLQRGATKAGLGLDDIRAVPVPLPPLAEQQQIVAEVERRLSVIEELEAAVQANLTRAERLRQSILSQAFSGRLLGQEVKYIPEIMPVLSIAAETQSGYGKDNRAGQ